MKYININFCVGGGWGWRWAIIGARFSLELYFIPTRLKWSRGLEEGGKTGFLYTHN